MTGVNFKAINSLLVRDVKGGIGPRAGSVKACCGAGLGRGLVGPFFCGTSGPGAVRYGPKEGRAKDDLRVSLSPATLILPFPFLPPPEETRERERESATRRRWV